MAHQDISKALNPKNYYDSRSLEPYYAFKLLREREAIEYSNTAKQWVDQQEQVLEDIVAQDDCINRHSNFIKPEPPKMSLSYKIQKVQTSSTQSSSPKCKCNLQNYEF